MKEFYFFFMLVYENFLIEFILFLLCEERRYVLNIDYGNNINIFF